MTAALPYTVALLYLTGVSLLLWRTGRVPFGVHPIVAVAGLAVPLVQQQWLVAAVAAATAAAALVFLVLLAGRTLSGVTLFTLVTSLAVCPPTGWPGLLLGVAAAACVAGYRTWRTLGGSGLSWLALDTAGAMGVGPGGLRRPDPSQVPEREVLAGVVAAAGTGAPARPMYLPPYLLAGVVLAAVVAVAA